MRVDLMLEEAQDTITLTNGKTLTRGDECLAGHPITLHYRNATIIDFIHGSGVQRALVRDSWGEEWIASRYALKAKR